MVVKWRTRNMADDRPHDALRFVRRVLFDAGQATYLHTSNYTDIRLHEIGMSTNGGLSWASLQASWQAFGCIREAFGSMACLVFLRFLDSFFHLIFIRGATD